MLKKPQKIYCVSISYFRNNINIILKNIKVFTVHYINIIIFQSDKILIAFLEIIY